MAIWAMASGDSVASLQPDLATAKAVCAAGGHILITPGDEAIALGAGWANIALCQVTDDGRAIWSDFQMADGADPTKRLSWTVSGVTTGTTRTISVPDWSGRIVVPVDDGTSGFYLRSGGAGVQPTWSSVSITNALLDGSIHTDTAAAAVARGALVVGNSTPAWDRLTIGSANTFLTSNGTDPSWLAISSLAALIQHDLLLHLKPIKVTNCSWANGSTTITHASGGLANVKVGDYVYLGDNTGTLNQGRRVTVWTDSNTITVDASNGNGTLTNQTFVFFPGDHWDDTMTMDSFVTGGGLFCTGGRGTYNATNTSGTFQEIQGPVRWRAHASGAQVTDFRLVGSPSTVTPSGFCLDRQGTANRVYFYVGALSAQRVLSIPNASGQITLDDNTTTISNKTIATINKIEMDGTAARTVFTLPAGGANRLAFDFTAMSALRAVTWPDFAGRARVEGAAVTFGDGDTTPSVLGSRLFKTNNTGATSISTFDDGIAGQEITVIIGDANTTLTDGATLVMAGSISWTPAATDTWTGVYDGSVWYEKCRSDNS